MDQIRARQSLLPIANISVACDAGNGQYSFLIEGAASKTSGPARFSLRGDFTPPDNGHSPPGLAGTGSAELIWSDLDLAGVPLPRLPRLDLAILTGKTSGQASLRLHSDRLELLNGTAAVDKLRLHLAEISQMPQTEQPQPAEVRIPRGSFKLQGAYQFASGELTVENLSGIMAGLDFDSSLKGRFVRDQGIFLPSDVSLKATVQPSRLREHFSFLVWRYGYPEQ